MNKSDLSSRVQAKTGLSKSQATTAVESVFDEIATALASGEKVSITGFGTFETKERQARTGRNPRTGKEIQIAASKSAGFRSGKGLKDRLG